MALWARALLGSAEGSAWVPERVLAWHEQGGEQEVDLKWPVFTAGWPFIPRFLWPPLCGEEPGVIVAFPRNVLSRLNAAGCSAIGGGVVGQVIDCPQEPAVEHPGEVCSPAGSVTKPCTSQGAVWEVLTWFMAL